MKKLILLFLLITSQAFANNIPSPPPLVNSPPELQHYLRSIADNLHQLQVVTTDPDGSRFGQKGDLIFYQSGGTNRICVNVDSVTDWECASSASSGYAAPSISLGTSPAGGVRETGDTSVTSVLLTATTVKHSDDITGVTYFRSSTLIHTEASPTAAGAAETYNDTTAVTSNTTYNAKVTDGTTLVTSNTVTFTFVYPFYYGVGASGLSGASIGGLTKLIEAQGNKTVTTSPSSQVYYFAYPASYPVLTSILDTNGFETIADYTVRTVNITGLDATSQSYRVYEFDHITTQTNFDNTYIF